MGVFNFDTGVRLFDTASAYGNEEEVGQAVRAAVDEAAATPRSSSGTP